MFVAVTAEESGLLGSEYFAQHPPVPVRNMVGGLNMDNLYAIGKTRDLTVIGFGASELDEYLRRAAAKQDRVLVQEPTPEKGFYYRSDHFNLAKQGVPMLYTKAGIDSPEHGPDYGRAWLDEYIAQRYHQPSDEYDASWDVSGTLQDLPCITTSAWRSRTRTPGRTGARAASSGRFATRAGHADRPPLKRHR